MLCRPGTRSSSRGSIAEYSVLCTECTHVLGEIKCGKGDAEDGVMGAKEDSHVGDGLMGILGGGGIFGGILGIL